MRSHDLPSILKTLEGFCFDILQGLYAVLILVQAFCNRGFGVVDAPEIIYHNLSFKTVWNPVPCTSILNFLK